MRIFVSYGHDCSVFINRLVNDLIILGHDIWVDSNTLKSGDDWRNEITEGIINSQSVLAFLSSHSLREESVCYDEINIAFTCNRQIIHPILMEKDILDRIPKIIRRVQFLDFSDWREKSKEDDWYNFKLHELLDLINSSDNEKYNIQMETLNISLRPNILKNKYLNELKQVYMTRSWLNDAIKTWKEQGNQKTFLLIAFPGFGKTCFCSNYHLNNPDIIALLYCEWSQVKKDYLSQMIRNLAFQIASKITSFRTRLLWMINTNHMSVLSMSARELFETLIIEPLIYEIDGDHENMIIILDGMDEATVNGTNTISELIVEYKERLPHYIRFIITSRRDTVILRAGSGAEKLEIKPYDHLVYQDILNFLKKKLSVCNSWLTDEYINKIAHSCEGSFLYAKLISEGIVNNTIDIRNNLLPESIFSIYYVWMSRLVTAEQFENEYYLAFSILAFSSVPVPISFIKDAAGWTTPKLNSFIRTLGNFLIEENDAFGNRCLMFFHSSFRLWMIDEDNIADVYSVSIEDGAISIAETICNLWRQKRIKKSEITYVWDYVNTPYTNNIASTFYNDNSFLDTLVCTAKECITDKNLFQYGLQAISNLENMCSVRNPSEHTDRIRDAEVPFLRAMSMFLSGDHTGVEKILANQLDHIKKMCSTEQYMRSLYLIGTSCDLLGKRDLSVHYFEKLYHFALLEDNKEFFNRSLVGLAWNNHFNNIHKLDRIIMSFKPIDEFTNDDDAMCNLVLARSLLSEGHLRTSLNLFQEVLNNAGSEIWGYNYLKTRNQMLLIETLVACYDNEEFDLGIRIGLEIYEHLSGMGTITECYCASWLSMNYLMNGMYEKSNLFLYNAEKLNDLGNSSKSSEWISMHLKSVRANYFNEKEMFEKSLKLHLQVVELAQKCSDMWVLGDALFETVLLIYYHFDSYRNLMFEYTDNLRKIAETSELPHLKYKSMLVDALTGNRIDSAFLQNIFEDTLEKLLPSTNPILSLFLCREIMKKAEQSDKANILKTKLVNLVDEIAQKNPNGRFKSRNMIQKIMKEISV